MRKHPCVVAAFGGMVELTLPRCFGKWRGREKGVDDGFARAPPVARHKPPDDPR